MRKSNRAPQFRKKARRAILLATLRRHLTRDRTFTPLPMNLKVGRAVLSPPGMAQNRRPSCGAVRTPRPTFAGRLRGSKRELVEGILSPVEGEELGQCVVRALTLVSFPTAAMTVRVYAGRALKSSRSTMGQTRLSLPST